MFKKSNIILFAILLISSLLLISCARLNYPYNNIIYETPELALAMHKKDLDSILAKIDPTQNPVGGTANVIIPSIEYIKINYITWKGSALDQYLKDQALNYHATLMFNNWIVLGHALEKRRMFDKVNITQTDKPEKAIFGEDTAIIVIKNKEGQAQWFVKRKKDTSGKLIPIEESSTALPPVQRMILRLDRIENIERGQKLS